MHACFVWLTRAAGLSRLFFWTPDPQVTTVHSIRLWPLMQRKWTPKLPRDYWRDRMWEKQWLACELLSCKGMNWGPWRVRGRQGEELNLRGWGEAGEAVAGQKQAEAIKEKTPWLKRKDEGEKWYMEWDGQSVGKERERNKSPKKEGDGVMGRQRVLYLCLATFRDTPVSFLPTYTPRVHVSEHGLTWAGLCTLEP